MTHLSHVRCCIVLLAAATIPMDASAAERLVRTSDEFAAAVSRAEPGDSIVLAAGPWRDADLVFDAEGRVDQPITLRSEIPGGTVFGGASRLRIGGRHLVVQGLSFQNAWLRDDVICFRQDSKRLASHCRVTDCAIVDCNPTDPKAESKLLSIYGDRNRVDRCYFGGKTSRGTTFVVWLPKPEDRAPPNDHRIDHNHFGPRPELKKNGGETIRIGDSNTSLTVSRTVVEDNLFEECNGEAEIISNKSCENVYRRNTFLRCSGALTLRHGNDCRVEGNFFLGQRARGTGGVRIIGEDHTVINNYFDGLEGDDTRSAISIMNGLVDTPLNGYFQVKRAVVAFNTMVDCKRPLTIGLADDDRKHQTLPPEDCTIANNLILARPKGHTRDDITAPTRLNWLGNSAIEMKSPLPRSPDGLWRPDHRTPAEGTFGFVTADIDGQPRVENREVGCDQLSDGPILHRPLGPADIGPVWRRQAARQ